MHIRERTVPSSKGGDLHDDEHEDELDSDLDGVQQTPRNIVSPAERRGVTERDCIADASGGERNLLGGGRGRQVDPVRLRDLSSG